MAYRKRMTRRKSRAVFRRTATPRTVRRKRGNYRGGMRF